MNPEPDFLKCPKRGQQMEVLRPQGMNEPPSKLLRICPFCETLAWTDEAGSVQTTEAHK